jgi:hypothetical protein
MTQRTIIQKRSDLTAPASSHTLGFIYSSMRAPFHLPILAAICGNQRNYKIPKRKTARLTSALNNVPVKIYPVNALPSFTSKCTELLTLGSTLFVAFIYSFAKTNNIQGHILTYEHDQQTKPAHFLKIK